MFKQVSLFSITKFFFVLVLIFSWIFTGWGNVNFKSLPFSSIIKKSDASSHKFLVLEWTPFFRH